MYIDIQSKSALVGARVCAAVVLAVFSTKSFCSEGPRDLVALSGQDPDGDGPIDFIDGFTGFQGRGSATINDDGDVSFSARAFPVDGVWQRSLMRVSSGQYETIVIGGESAAGTSEAIFFGVTEEFYAPSMNSSRDVAFRYQLVIGVGDAHEGNDEGIWMAYGDSTTPKALVAREGDVAPGTGGARFGGGIRNTFSRPALSDTGKIAFSASLIREGSVNDTNDSGIWVYSDGTLELLARSGSSAPGIDGGIFEQFFFPDFAPSPPLVLSMNSLGEVAFRARSTDPTLKRGIWVTRSGELELLVADGQQAPGTGGALFNIRGSNTSKPVVMNDAGVIPMIESSGAQDRRSGVWITRPDGMERIVKDGDLLPGSSVESFVQFGNPDTNSSAELAFPAWIDPGDGSDELSYQIWTYQDESLIQVATIGDMIRGTGGYIIRSLGGTATLNDLGDIVFEGAITRSDQTFGSALFAYSSTLEEVVLIAEVGELIDVSLEQNGSDFRDIRVIQFDDELHTANNRPEPRDGSTGLNDHGEIAYVVGVDGGSAVYVTKLRSCKADLNGDGNVDFFDVSHYLNLFTASSPLADIDDNPGLDFFDISKFLGEYAEGCP